MSSSLQRGRARLSVNIPDRKHVDFDQPSYLSGGNLSPDLQPATPPTYPNVTSYTEDPTTQQASRICNYVLLPQTESVGDIPTYRAFHCDTQVEYECKVLPITSYRETLAPYWVVGDNDHINQIEEIILGQSQAYVIFPRNYGDLHSYVRKKRRLREIEAGRLYHQIIDAIAHCHKNGVVLRDLKLRKFVFKNPERTELKLESLEDAFVLGDDNDDCLADKHGCPAYVSPEILNTSGGYSGRAADSWSAGVMLYTLLVGRYPFHDAEPTALFSKIRKGDFHIPDTVSSRAKCLIKCLLRLEPKDRLSPENVLQHAWFRTGSRIYGNTQIGTKLDPNDQTVPEFYSSENSKEPDNFLV
jgi:tribbles-like protein